MCIMTSKFIILPFKGTLIFTQFFFRKNGQISVTVSKFNAYFPHITGCFICKFIHKLFLFFKMNHGLSPLYLSNLLPLHVGELSSYRLRNAENYVGIHANTRAYAESFLPSTLQAWNNLPEAVRSADTLGAFKHLLSLVTPKVPAYYDCGDRLDQISHTRLRTECSSLNQHLFRRNLVQNPYCLCGEIEDNKHFLLTCPRHTQMRAEMVLSIQQKTNVELTTDVLLFGTDGVSEEVNTFIFKAVQKCIKLSKRFSQ